MNAQDVLRRGHMSILEAIETLPEDYWYRPGVAGVWSVRDILAHLASYELVFVEILRSFAGEEPGPLLARFREGPDRYRETEVAARHELTAAEVLAEYDYAHGQTIPLVAQISDEVRRQEGTLPWYAKGVSLDDYIVYEVYGHKREHSAQIGVYRGELEQAETVAEGGYTTG